MSNTIAVAYRKDSELRAVAEVFLKRVHPSATIPIPIERIVEGEGLNIIPVLNLRALQHQDGYTSLEASDVYVDEKQSETYPNRYRFTLAHEMGHVVLHSHILKVIRTPLSTRDAYRGFLLGMEEQTRRRFEFQADMFAGTVLVPLARLLQEYRSEVVNLAPALEAARQATDDGAMIAGEAWNTIKDRLSQSFCVSRGTIGHRLRQSGLMADETAPPSPASRRPRLP